jgi:predicted dehydrogenase
MKKLAKLAARGRKIVHVGLTYRYSAYHDMVQDLLWNPADPCGVGEPHAFLHLDSDGGAISRWYNRDEMTGGTYVSSMFDQLDEAIAIFGKVKDLMARYRAVRKADGVIEEDCCSAMVVFENRCTAQIVYTRGYPRPALPIERTFICEKGHIRIQGGEIRILTAQGERKITLPEKDALLLDTADFLNGMEKGRPVDDTFEKALYALKISERAMRMAIG